MLAWLHLTCEGARLGAETGRDEMKYMIMTFGDTSALEGKSPEWIKEMIEFMQRIDVELTERGRTLTPGSNWGPLEVMTVGYGHGIAVTPLHFDLTAEHGLDQRDDHDSGAMAAVHGALRRHSL